MALSECYSGTWLGQVSEAVECPVKIAGVAAEIQTGHIKNVSLECYHHTILLGKIFF
jgi:hypothetical protein